MKHWTADRWIATMLLALSVVYVVAAWRLPKFAMTTVVDANVFPAFVGIVQAGLAGWLWVISSGDRANRKSPWGSLEIKPGLFLLVLSAFYIEALEPVGFIVTTFAFLTIAPLILGWRKWKVSTALAISVSLGIFYLFSNILMVPLPEGIFGL